MKRHLLLLSITLLIFACGKEPGASRKGCGTQASTPPDDKPPPTQLPVEPVEPDRTDKFSFPPVGPGIWAGGSGNVNESGGVTGIWSSGGPLVIAVGEGFVYRSTDRGLHFSRSSTASIQGRSPVVWGSDKEIYVGGGAAMYRSTDGGETFAQTSSTSMATIQAIHGLSANEVFAAGAKSVVRTTDQGTTWKQLTTPLKSGWLYGLTSTEDKSAIFVSGKEDTTKRTTSTGMFETNAVVFRSTDKGETWERLPMFDRVNTDFEESRQVCFTSGVLFAASAYGLFMTKDLGKSWQYATAVGTEVLALGCRGNDVIVGGRNRALLVSRDLGATWKREELVGLFTHPPLVSVESIAIGGGGEAFVGFEGLYDAKKGSVFRRAP